MFPPDSHKGSGESNLTTTLSSPQCSTNPVENIMLQKTTKYSPSHKKVTLAGKVVEREGSLHISLNSPPLYAHFLKTYTKPGDNISMIVIAKKPKRSESQNNFYHLYLSLVSLSSGHTMDELKAWVREEILSEGVAEIYGDKVHIAKSSADLNMSEFCEMMNTLEDRTGIPIPDPAPFNIPLTFDEYGHLKLVQQEHYKKLKSNI